MRLGAWWRRCEPVHSNFATFRFMKSSQLPPVRVEPIVGQEIESVLRPGETLSQFVESAAVQTAQRHKSQQEFLTRGCESLKRAMKTGKYYAAAEALDAMQTRLDERMAGLGRDVGVKMSGS
jgi:hypothetical protein